MTRTWKRMAAPAAALTAAAFLAACSSSSSTPATTSSSTTPSGSVSASSSAMASSTAMASPSSSPTAATSAGVADAEAMVKQFEAIPAHSVPATPIKGVAALKGKTVYYVPLVQQISGFVLTAEAMKTALAKVGMKLQVCNGMAQPAAIAACIGQATGAGAAGIVLDSIPGFLATNAITAANAKGIPVIVTDQEVPAGAKNTDKLTYVPGALTQPDDIAYWTIADSGGKANTLITQYSDPSETQYITNSRAIYAKDCPGCTVTVKTLALSAEAQWTSSISSFLLAAPSATYFYTEFEDSLQNALSAIATAHKSSLKLSVAGGTVDGLGDLAKGSGSPVKAVVAVDQIYAGWSDVDEVLRMATKSAPVSNLIFPTRLFTAGNIGSIQVTPAAQSSGAWFGGVSSYQTAFAKDWGV